jgi:hypothetical protein
VCADRRASVRACVTPRGVASGGGPVGTVTAQTSLASGLALPEQVLPEQLAPKPPVISKVLIRKWQANGNAPLKENPPPKLALRATAAASQPAWSVIVEYPAGQARLFGSPYTNFAGPASVHTMRSFQKTLVPHECRTRAV